MYESQRSSMQREIDDLRAANHSMGEELKQKENKAKEAAAGEGVEKTPWEESVKALEEEFWAQIGTNKEGAEPVQLE